MAIDIKVSLTKDYILSKVTQEQIMEKYLGIGVDVTRTFQNPFREDSLPGCRFYYDSRGVLKFHDFSQHWNWDCFNVVQHLNKCTFMEALKIIADDFNTSSVTVNVSQTTTLKQQTKLQIASVEWNNHNLKLWNEISVDRELLNYFNVKPIKAFWINGVRYNIGRQENAYAYCFPGGKIKIYLPDRDFNRFYQNCSADLIQGWEQLPTQEENLIITKSYKDAISFRAFGYYAIAPISEKVIISEERFIDLYNRFDNIYCLMDNDWPGKISTVKYIKTYPSIIPLLFPLDMKKDWTDNLKQYGEHFMIDLIEDTKIRLAA